ARAIGPRGHDLAKFFVEIGDKPPAMPEAAGAVLVWAPGGLPHAVQSHEGAHHQLSHVPLLQLVGQQCVCSLRIGSYGIVAGGGDGCAGTATTTSAPTYRRL